MISPPAACTGRNSSIPMMSSGRGRRCRAQPANTEPFQFEYRIRHQDGSERWVWEQGQGVYNGTDEPVAFEGFVTDVTERKRAEAASATLAAIVESSDDAIISKSLDGVITSWNKSAERMFGYTAAEAVGQPITMLIPPDRLDEEPRILERLKRGERVDHFETIRVRKDGSRLDISLTISPVKDADGRIIGASKVARDITERKQAEAALRLREQELADFFDNAALGLHWVGPDGIILRVNQAELTLLGYTRDEYVGHHIAEFHADQHVIEDLLRRLHAGEELHDYEARLVCKDGTIKHALIDSNVLWEQGQFIHTRCFTRDITAQKQAEALLQQAHATLEQRVQERTALVALMQDVTGPPTRPLGVRRPCSMPWTASVPIRAGPWATCIWRWLRARTGGRRRPSGTSTPPSASRPSSRPRRRWSVPRARA